MKKIFTILAAALFILFPVLVSSQIKYVALDIPQEEIQRCLSNISENKAIENLKIYPNPSCEGEINIKIPSMPDGKSLLIDIYNINGVKVYNKKLMPERLMNQNEINLQGVSSGIYLVIITSGDAVHKTKLTVLEQN